MRTFSGNNLDVALFVERLAQLLNENLPSITITFRGRLEGCSVSVVTNTSSDAIVSSVALSLYERQYNTLKEITQDG